MDGRVGRFVSYTYVLLQFLRFRGFGNYFRVLQFAGRFCPAFNCSPHFKSLILETACINLRFVRVSVCCLIT